MIRYKQKQLYKNIGSIFFVSSLLLTGCITNKSMLPSFEGKPRIKINQDISRSNPATQHTAALSTKTKEAL